MTDLSQDTTRKSKFLQKFHADTSREFEDLDKKLLFFHYFSKKGDLFEFREGDLWFKVVQNVDFCRFRTFGRVHFLNFCALIPFARE